MVRAGIGQTALALRSRTPEKRGCSGAALRGEPVTGIVRKDGPVSFEQGRRPICKQCLVDHCDDADEKRSPDPRLRRAQNQGRHVEQENSSVPEALYRAGTVSAHLGRSGRFYTPTDNRSVNATIESFFSTLKTERVNRSIYRARDATRADVFD